MSPEAFGRAGARMLIGLLDGPARRVVGLATGRTPIPVYEALHSLTAAGELNLSAMDPFALDEYVGPREHPCSNHAFFQHHWRRIAGAGAVHEFDPQAADLEREAARFAAELDAAGGLDVAVLGIGTNGHLAFNEPGSPRDSRARAVELTPATREAAASCWGPEPPARGLTLGLHEILGAGRILLLAAGTHKAAMVAAALRGPVGMACPASFLQEHGGVVVMLDEEAAGLLRA